MPRLFAVRLSCVAIVEADDPEEAKAVAAEFKRDIVSDLNDFDYDLAGINVRQDQLELWGWDGMCIAYGGDGNTRLKDSGHD